MAGTRSALEEGKEEGAEKEEEDEEDERTSGNTNGKEGRGVSGMERKKDFHRFMSPSEQRLSSFRWWSHRISFFCTAGSSAIVDLMYGQTVASTLRKSGREVKISSEEPSAGNQCSDWDQYL